MLTRISTLVSQLPSRVKFIYSETATKFCEIFPLFLNTVHTVKSKGKILQNFVAFSEYMNFTTMDKLSKDVFVAHLSIGRKCFDFQTKTFWTWIMQNSEVKTDFWSGLNLFWTYLQKGKSIGSFPITSYYYQMKTS